MLLQLDCKIVPILTPGFRIVKTCVLSSYVKSSDTIEPSENKETKS